MFDPADEKTWHRRLTTREVLAIARFGQTTLWRRVRAGTMPKPIDAGRQSIFDRDAVLKALGMVTDEPDSQKSAWDITDADRAHFARKIRHSPAAKGRDAPSAARGAEAAPAGGGVDMDKFREIRERQKREAADRRKLQRQLAKLSADRSK